MAICYHRKIAWLVGGQGLKFKKPACDCQRVTIPCGKCMACRVNNASAWALRAQHEMEYVDSGCMINLTYAPKYCPKDYSLVKKDLQDFMKRLRRHIEYHEKGEIRSFLACGEYGDERGRPHYHVLVFGWKPSDLKFYKFSHCGDPIYISPTVQRVWGKGFSPIGSVNYKTAGYVARYAKKAVGDKSKKRVPPFLLSSRRIPLTNGENGALGAQWCLDNLDNLRFGFIRHKEKPDLHLRIPEYYFDLCERWKPELYALIKDKRFDFAMEQNDGFFYCDQHGDIAVGWDDEEIWKYWRDTPDGITKDGTKFYKDLGEISLERTLRLIEDDKKQTEQLKLLRRQLHEKKSKKKRIRS